jgi:hypothetical protein
MADATGHKAVFQRVGTFTVYTESASKFVSKGVQCCAAKEKAFSPYLTIFSVFEMANLPENRKSSLPITRRHGLS